MLRRPSTVAVGIGLVTLLTFGACRSAAVSNAGNENNGGASSVIATGSAPRPTMSGGSTSTPGGGAPMPNDGSTSTSSSTTGPTVSPTPVPNPPTGPTTKAPPRAGAATLHPTATTRLALVDNSRATVSRGSTVAASRSLPTTVYYPTDGDGPFPLVVFAHGFEIGPGPYARWYQILAAAGYVVAAPSFPLTDRAAAGANLDRGDLPNQGADVAFVFNGVINAATSGPLSGRVDGSRLGVVGHSDGADTALDVGYYPGRNDARVKAVVAVAPDAMSGPGGSVGRGVPLLLVHGDRDSIVPLANSQTVFGQVSSRRFFAVMLGADHLPPVQGAAPWAPALEQVTIDFLDRYVAARTNQDDAIVEHGTRPGVMKIEVRG